MPKFMKNKKFWIIAGISLLFIAIIGWIAGAATIVYMAPKLTFDVAKSKNLEYDVPYTTALKPNSAGENIEILITNGENLDYLGKPKQVILYLHGNVGRRPYIVKDASKYGMVVSPAYPGYSQSGGEASADKIYETVDVTMNYLKDLGYEEKDIIVLGHSLGGSPAMYAAEKYPDLKRVVIVNTFYSMQKMCETRYSILCIFSGGFMNTANIAPKAKAKIRMFCNPQDDYIPPQQCRDLFEKVSSEDKKVFDISGTHDIFPVETALTQE
jgi:pimeloyl-ACP methyl ester carboxylesterase